MKALQRRFRSKLKNNDEIYNYIKDGKIDIETIMLQYTNYVYAIIKNKDNYISNEDIEEIISDVFLTLWNNQEKLDINKALSPYIAGITKNLIKKKYRNKNLMENIEDYEEILVNKEDIILYSEEKERNEIIIQELDKMKKEDRKIFYMFYYENKKIKEIANILKFSQSRVKMKLSRTKEKLRKLLKERGM